MARQQQTSFSEYPLPDSLSAELQVLADMVSLPETIREAQRILKPSSFSDEQCRDAYETLLKMSKDGMVIDLPSAYGRLDRGLMQKGIMPMMSNVGSHQTSMQHFSMLKDLYVKRKCYFKAMELLISSSDSRTTTQDIIGKVGSLADRLRLELDAESGSQHISEVINDLGEQIEENKRDRESGKVLRVPTGFYTLDFLTYGGWHRGNLVILAARPSVGKTAVMLQMARAAANAGKAVQVFNLEMTNVELAQRFLFSTGRVTPVQIARGDVEWTDFEYASGQFASKPIYLSDSVYDIDEIRQRIILSCQSGKCDVAFIDYLGLIRMRSARKGSNLSEIIAETTKGLKHLAKECKIPIILLCQLNRVSAAEKRAPEMHDLRDSGGIEQDADAILMLERAGYEEDGRDINIWVRKNRGGKAGNVKVEIEANETYTEFRDKNDPRPPMPTVSNDFENDFDNNQDMPF